MKFNKCLLLSLVILINACGQPADQNSNLDALVSSEQATRAYEIVADLPYIPFSYTVDGCYARSLYMSMELASEGIPSSAFYLYGNLQPGNGVSWGWHVAPLIVLQNSSGYKGIMLDPAFQKEPLALADWIKSSNPQGKYSTYYESGSKYFYGLEDSSEFFNTNPEQQPLIKSFSEMDAFRIGDIYDACSTLHRYLRNTRDTASNIKARQAQLVERTSELVDSLNHMGMLVSGGVAFEYGSLERNPYLEKSCVVNQ